MPPRPRQFTLIAAALLLCLPAGLLGLPGGSLGGPAPAHTGSVAALVVAGIPTGLTLGTPPVNWTNASPSGSPSKRAESSMTYDAADGFFLLFGGHSGNALLGDTWKFTASGQWVQLHPKVSPPPRRGASMIYDGVDHYVLLFGGSDYRHFLNDTWSFHAGKWTQLFPATSPSPRRVAGITYDVALQEVLLFGGHNGSLSVPAKYIFHNDTWTYRSGVWTPLVTPNAPAPRGEPMIVFDAADGYVVEFGGYNYHTTYGDTWVLQGSRWTNITTNLTGSPPARDGGGVAYDYNGGGVVLYGGHQGGKIFNDMWWYRGGQWTALRPAVSPPKLGGVPLAWDRTAGYGVIFGGLGVHGWLNQTWVLRP